MFIEMTLPEASKPGRGGTFLAEEISWPFPPETGSLRPPEPTFGPFLWM